MSRLFRYSIAVLLAVLILPTVASAQALQSFSGGTLFGTFEADGDTVGWRFTVNRPIIVTHLGFWDGDNATQPMVLSHPVGLWDNAGNLLTSNTVNPTSPLTGAFRYEPTANVQIPAGTYNLGAFYSATNPISDGYMTSTTGIVMASGFTMNNTLRDPTGPQTGLVFPSLATAVGGRFGPNILFTEVPEPASMAGVALFAVGAMFRRRRA
jgi:hypothetical protein